MWGAAPVACKKALDSILYMHSILHRVRRSLATRGLQGTGRMCWYSLTSLVSPVERSRERHRRQTDEEFDRLWGVSTGGLERPAPGEVIGPRDG